MLAKLAYHHQLVFALWIAVVYLLTLYAALRWGTGSTDRYPGSD